MRKVFGIILSLLCVVAVYGQTVTNADCYEENQKAIVTYSLDKKANVDLQVSINNSAFQSLDRTSLSGDVGTNVKKGTHKKIVWDVLKDCNSLVGDVQFRVVPSESLDDYNKRIKKAQYQRSGYPATCNAYFSEVGTWSISFLDGGLAGGIHDQKGKVPMYFGLGTFRYKFIEIAPIAFSWELTSASRDADSYTYYSSDSDIYWEPQLRFLLPMTSKWAFVFSGGPSLKLGDKEWSYAVTARARYGMRLLNMDLFAGYEHETIVAGLHLSLNFGR